jgi:hypothetical protein
MSLTLILLLSILFVAYLRVNIGKRFDHFILGILAAARFTYLIGFVASYAAAPTGSSIVVWHLFHGFSNVRFFG